MNAKWKEKENQIYPRAQSGNESEQLWVRAVSAEKGMERNEMK